MTEEEKVIMDAENEVKRAKAAVDDFFDEMERNMKESINTAGDLREYNKYVAEMIAKNKNADPEDISQILTVSEWRKKRGVE